jgi:hypothetical protein
LDIYIISDPGCYDKVSQTTKQTTELSTAKQNTEYATITVIKKTEQNWINETTANQEER